MTFAIRGPECAPCAARIEGELLRVPHVIDARLDIPGHRVTVWLSDAHPDVRSLTESIQSSGFQASRVRR